MRSCRYTDKEICFCFNEDTFTIVDVTDKANMALISKTAYVNVAYTHQVYRRLMPHCMHMQAAFACIVLEPITVYMLRTAI